MDLERLLRHQDGVVSRSQVLSLGVNDDDIARLIRRRVWARIFEGVYIDHTGPSSWRQRAWAATLLHRPAALDGTSALAASGAVTARREDPIELVISAQRRVDDPVGIHTRRARGWDRVVQLHLSPPRVRLETAALTAASRCARDEEAVALLGDLVQQPRTTAPRLRSELLELSRLPRRRLLAEVLDDVSQGVRSALERRYLRDVERAHRLPRGQRQARAAQCGIPIFRDVLYPRLRTIIELDGRLGHELWRDRWDDLERDLVTLAAGTVTIRVGWGQVLQPCRLAGVLGRALVTRGWGGRPVRCGRDCVLT